MWFKIPEYSLTLIYRGSVDGTMGCNHACTPPIRKCFMLQNLVGNASTPMPPPPPFLFSSFAGGVFSEFK